MEKSIKSFGYNKYSQNNEDGILYEVIRRIGIANKVAVEFGGHDGKFCSNTRALADIGWMSYMYDINPVPPVIQKEITPENVNDLPPCSVLSIDIDGNDYAVWKAYNGKPDIVVIEINSSLPPNELMFSEATGTSFAMMNALAERKGYFLLCHTGNCIYVRKEHQHLFPDADQTFNTQWL